MCRLIGSVQGFIALSWVFVADCLHPVSDQSDEPSNCMQLRSLHYSVPLMHLVFFRKQIGAPSSVSAMISNDGPEKPLPLLPSLPPNGESIDINIDD